MTMSTAGSVFIDLVATHVTGVRNAGMSTTKKFRRKQPAHAIAGAVSVTRALSKLGVASRTLAAVWIAAGRVAVNGKLVTSAAQRVDMARDRIALDGAPLQTASKRYCAFNKPRGLVTTTRDEQGRASVYDALPALRAQWLAPVGRLDKASEGLLLFTNDTQWAQRVLDPLGAVAKVYHVQIDALPDVSVLDALRAGVVLDDGECTAPATVRILRQGGKTAWLEITLQEGRNRQIRRMLARFDISVRRLVRVAIGTVQLGDLAKGALRDLTPQEITALGGSAWRARRA